MTPDISTIIPAFRRQKELGEAIVSVLSQSGVRIEVIVVDDSPEGSARPVVEALQDTRVKYLQNVNPTGGVPSIVRNLGLSHAQGRLIHFLDDDDIVPDGHYARVLGRFGKRPEAGLVFGAIRPFGSGPEQQLAEECRFFEKSCRVARLCRSSRVQLSFVSCHLFVHLLLVCSAGVVRRECVTAVGGFDPRLRIMEDADFYTFVMRRFDVDFIDDVTLNYRISSNQSLMHTANPSAEYLANTSRDLRDAREKTYVKYRSAFGWPEFLAMKTFVQTALLLVP